MYPTSATWDTLVTDPLSNLETRVKINEVYYEHPQLINLDINRQLFADSLPGVGGCYSSKLNLTMLTPSVAIPRMAKVEPFVRLVKGLTTSEWIPQGKYFIDTRETTDDDGIAVLTIEAFDSMLKTEDDFPSTTHSWAASPYRVVQDIASAIGVSINSETVTLLQSYNSNLNYRIGLPLGYSMREVLSNIASMLCGNWIMDYDGKLELVTLTSLPVETNYLIDQLSDAITFGGDRILV